MEKKSKISRKVQKIILGVCIVAVLGLGIGLFAYIHIIDTTTMGRKISVDGLDISQLSVEEAQQKILNAFQNKKVSFVEDGETIYQTTLRDLGYTLDETSLNSQLSALKEERAQKFTLLPSQKDYEIEYHIQKNEEQEKNALTEQHFAGKERTASRDASVQYNTDSKQFELISDIQGNQIDETKLLSYTEETLETAFEKELLAKEAQVTLGTQVYQDAAVTVSEEMQTKVAELNQELGNYRSTTVTYVFGNTTEVIDLATIDSWLKIDGETISIDQDAAASYVSNLANTYNTIYIPRTFHTSTGTDVVVQDNEYGYRIDQDAEVAQLLEDLKSGTAVTREPIYSKNGMQRNGTDDLVGSYIEVSLDAQHLWLYKDGSLVTETDIVSGSPSKEETYRGAWPIAYKASPFTLSSEENGYSVEVKYWMPFVYGQGLHDANWQPAFGGDRYRTGNGSHGCINLPEDQAALIYNTIDGGYPIIIY